MRRFLLTPMILTAASAGAQTTWVNPVSGAWSNAANWSPANVPDTAGETAQLGLAGPYVVDWDLATALGGLNISQPAVTLNMQGGRAMFYSGATLTNTGLFVINPTGANAATYLRLDTGACTFAGSGTIRLNANPGNLDTAHLGTLNGGFTFTNGAGHTIAGTGRIRTALSNQGLVSADVNGAVLQMADNAKANFGMMRASGGGTLQFSSVNVNNTGGQIVADGAGSVVSIVSSSISEGSITATNGGVATSAENTLSSVTIAGPFELSTGSRTSLHGTGLVNNGTITINPSGGNAATYFRTDANGTSILGSGTVVLNANSANLDTAHLGTLNGGFVMTVGAEQTIRGTGRIRVNTTNEGMIEADVADAMLELSDNAKTNNSVMRAIDGGVLQINAITVTNTDGEIRAEADSTVTVVNSQVNGGTLAGLGGGVVGIFNSGIAGATLEGEAFVYPGALLRMMGDITNNADITINPDGANAATYMRLDVANAAFNGTGSIHLNANAANLDTAHIATLNGGFTLTLAEGQVVDGTGRVRVRGINNGLIDANVTGRPLEITDNPKTNNGIMRATNGGILAFESVGVTNNAQILSDGAGSVVSLSNTTLAGGELGAISGGLNAVQNSTFSDVTISGPLNVNPGTQLSLTGGGLTNEDEITVNPTGANNSTYIRLNVAAGTLAGDGVVRLNANPANLDTAHLATLNGGFELTNAADHTIAGTGRVRVRTLNQGLIEADVPGAVLELADTLKTNQATMRARNGGFLSINNIPVDNTLGQIVADGASAAVGLYNTGLTGGLLLGTNGGTSNSSNSAFNGVTIAGPHDVNAGALLVLAAGGITNNGVLRINPNGVNNSTYIRLDAAAATIGGNGETQLNANLANLDTSHIGTLNGGFQLTLGPAHALTGTGRVRVNTINRGRLSPGTIAARIGQIDLLNLPWEQKSESQLAIDLGGSAPGEYDRVTGGAAVSLDGALLVGLVNGFAPAMGSEFTILSCGSLNGQFSDIVAPGLGGDDQWRVRYSSNSATLVVTCRFDIDGDLSVGLADLAVLLSHFGVQEGATERDGDIDTDGDVDISDLAELLGRFGTACN